MLGPRQPERGVLNRQERARWTEGRWEWRWPWSRSWSELRRVRAVPRAGRHGPRRRKQGLEAPGLEPVREQSEAKARRGRAHGPRRSVVRSCVHAVRDAERGMPARVEHAERAGRRRAAPVHGFDCRGAHRQRPLEHPSAALHRRPPRVGMLVVERPHAGIDANGYYDVRFMDGGDSCFSGGPLRWACPGARGGYLCGGRRDLVVGSGHRTESVHNH